MAAADDRTAVKFALTPGQAGDAPAGRALLNELSKTGLEAEYLILDRAYEGDETRQLTLDRGFTPVVPPKINRMEPWQYDREMYKRRNDVERLFRRLKGFRRIFSRFDTLDIVYMFFLFFALIFETIKQF